jgi:hypothetical protein
MAGLIRRLSCDLYTAFVPFFLDSLIRASFVFSKLHFPFFLFLFVNEKYGGEEKYDRD